MSSLGLQDTTYTPENFIMLNVDDALERILATIHPLSAETVDLRAARGRILASNIHALHALPPFANSAMDGYAVIAADVEAASKTTPVRLAVIEDIPAGHAPQKSVTKGQAARIMTGAPMPAGADSVVPVEWTDDPRHDTMPPEIGIFQSVAAGAHVRAAGEDIHAGENVLFAGRHLRAADIGVIAGLGYPTVQVIRRPRIAIFSTGDELVELGVPLTPGKIRDMNGYTLPAMITELGAEPLMLGIARDTVQDVREKLTAAIEQKADLIVSSAGVSVGAFDVVKTVLEEMGTVNFWQVNMRPGKPLTFGHVSGVPFLGLPGNPVSAMVTFDVFARPMICKMLTISPDTMLRVARLGEPMTSDGRMTFARVRLIQENGELVAYSTGTQSSGALSSMIKADGLLIIPAGITEVEKGDQLAVRPFTH